MDEERSGWLRFVGGFRPYRDAIANGFSTDGLIVGDCVEALAKRINAEVVVVFSTSDEPRLDEIDALSANADSYTIVLVESPDPNDYVIVLSSGADGVAQMDSTVEHIVAVTAAALRHDCVLPTAVLRRLLERPSADQLSETSAEILRCLDSGLNAKQIASELNVSDRTARRRIQNLYLTLGVERAASAVNVARERGMYRSSR